MNDFTFYAQLFFEYADRDTINTVLVFAGLLVLAVAYLFMHYYMRDEGNG